MDILLTDRQIRNIEISTADREKCQKAIVLAQHKRDVEWLEAYEICDPITHKLEGYWISVEDMLEFTATGEEATNETA